MSRSKHNGRWDFSVNIGLFSKLQPSQQKLAEKLPILNDRGVGMLTRLYNIKQLLCRVQLFVIPWTPFVAQTNVH